MLSVLITNTKTKGHEESLEGVGYMYYFDWVMVSQIVADIQIHQSVYIKYVQFLYPLYLNKAVKMLNKHLKYAKYH